MLLVTSAVLSIAWLPAQEPEASSSPCDSPLIQKVNQAGLESLRWQELPFFFRDVYRCRRTPAGKAVLKKLEQHRRTRSYESARLMKGFSSTLAYCTSVIIFVFYTSRLFSG
ncbi:MAG: hypothetical protein ACE5DP_04415 [Fidelibacterota bacterium]